MANFVQRPENPVADSVFVPAFWMDSLYEGACELLGEEKIIQILASRPSHRRERENLPVGSHEDAADFLLLLEPVFGKSSAQGLALRIGRSSFKYTLKRMGHMALLHDSSFHLLPVRRRLEAGLTFLAEYLSAGNPTACSVTRTDTHWLWHTEMAQMPGIRQGFDPTCFAFTGMLQEFMLWAGNGRCYRVVQTQCHSAGSPRCEFQIDQTPLD